MREILYNIRFQYSVSKQVARQLKCVLMKM
jgi:hypothetical protein